MSYGQLHILLEQAIIHETNTYKLSKLNNEIWIKIKIGEQTIHSIRGKTLESKFTQWMSITYAKTQSFWYSNHIQKAFTQGISKAEKLHRGLYHEK